MSGELEGRVFMSAKHGDPPRGLMSTARSPLFDGKFGRLFRSLPPATFFSEMPSRIHSPIPTMMMLMKERDAPTPDQELVARNPTEYQYCKIGQEQPSRPAELRPGGDEPTVV